MVMQIYLNSQRYYINIKWKCTRYNISYEKYYIFIDQEWISTEYIAIFCIFNTSKFLLISSGLLQ